MRRRTLLALVLPILLLAACGGGDDDAPDADAASASSSTESAEDDTSASEASDDAGSDECPLLASEVEAVTGFEVEGPTPEDAGNGVGCTFTYGDDDAASISVRVFFDSGQASHDGFTSTFEDEAEEVADLGDAAVWVASIGTVDVVDGDDGVQVQIVDAIEPKPIADPKQVAIDLARLVLASR